MIEPYETIDELVELIDRFGLNEAELTRGGFRVKLSRAAMARSEQEAPDPFVPALPIPRIPSLPSIPAGKGIPIESPMTGIFYASPSPDSPALAPVGSEIEVGQVIALIEAMKVFNEITSTVAGKVLSVHFAGASLVQAGDVLFLVDPR